MWGQRFYGSHKTAKGGGCFWRLQRFSVSVWVWGMRFFAHDLHGYMLKWQRCGCGSMQRLDFSPRKNLNGNESAMQVGQLAWPIRIFSPVTKPSPAAPISNFATQKAEYKSPISNNRTAAFAALPRPPIPLFKRKKPCLKPRDLSAATSPPLYKAPKFNMLMKPKNANTDYPS
jgi:hypothetical protein